MAFAMLGPHPDAGCRGCAVGRQSGLQSELRAANEGIVLVLVTVVATAVISPLVFMTVAGRTARTHTSHYAVIVVPTTFWLTIMMGGWPFNRISLEPAGRRSSRADRRYVINVVFRLFFNYDFLQGAPVYLQSRLRGCQWRLGTGVLRHGARCHVPGALLRLVAASRTFRR